MIPTGYEKLAAIGIAYKGEYIPGSTYDRLNGVYYDGSTYVALKDGLTSEPVADGVNWQYMAKGFLEGVLSAIDATDASGVLGTAGATVDAQNLIDAIADKVMTKLITKNSIVNNFLSTDPETALSGAMGKLLDERLTSLNGDLGIIKYAEGQVPHTTSDDARNQAIKSFVDDLPAAHGIYLAKFVYGSTFLLLIQKYHDTRYSSVFVISYALSQPLYFRKSVGQWLT